MMTIAHWLCVWIVCFIAYADLSYLILSLPDFFLFVSEFAFHLLFDKRSIDVDGYSFFTD